MYRIVKGQNNVICHFDPIYCGVSINKDNISFNWKHDDQYNDTISLCSNSCGNYNKDNVRYFYGYRFTKNASSKDKKIFRDYLKGKIDPGFMYQEDVEKFVEYGVLSLDEFYSLNNYSGIVRAESTGGFSILNVIGNCLLDHSQSIHSSFNLIKKMYQDVQFNAELARKALYDCNRYSEDEIDEEINFTLNKFENLKESGQLFQMKRFIPKEIREGFFDFLQFKSEYDRRLYASLQGVDILIYDDFLTSGSTIKEMVRCLRSIHDENRLTVFVLMKQ